MRLLVRWLISAAALLAAAYLVPGIRVEGSALPVVLGMAIIFGLVNALIRPLLALLSCGLIIVTMGLFMLVINGTVLWLASYIAVNWFHVGFYVDGFWAAFLGGLAVSVVTFILSVVFPDPQR